MNRYRIGFESPTTKSTWTEANLGYIPVVDYETPFVFGSVVALFTDKELAQTVVDFLNTLERAKRAAVSAAQNAKRI